MSSFMGWILPMFVVSRWWCVLFIVAINRPEIDASNEYRPYLYSAIVNITYKDPKTGELASERKDIGRYGTASRRDPEWGWVVHVRSADNKTDGCQPPVNVPSVRWVALIQRGSCKFHEKIYNAAIVRNASAVVIYNNKQEVELLTMEHKVDDVVSIFIHQADGQHIAQLVDNGTYVRMYITFGSQHSAHYPSINKTSVLFVSISFIVLMIISLAWLIFYYIQRFRYAHAKERLSKRLMHAAKKAVSKMPVRTVKHGDKVGL
ncbi:hypothetical protein NP493_243g02017 [Ridgeia piscesae]|uniref:PA domain-containing protein n=1 Tax=Ridgeia piscesae TaxID=27915 RepID=A0AAD9UDD8_RIDPI|nr:hypothetical protein NP493_243g02017 [Ridgeia piscesae]